MARETKVGLLAGLAFIICFAIILANRGRQDLIPAQLTSNGETYPGGGVYHNAKSTSPAAGSDRRVVETRTPRRMRKSVPPRADRNMVAEPQPALSESETVAAGGRRTGRTVDGPPNRTPDGTQTTQTVASTDSVEQMRGLEKRLDELSRQLRLESRSPQQPAQPPVMEASEPTSAPAASGPVRTPPVLTEVARYTVAAGDTLSAIAARSYGGKSRRLVDAIFDANRAVLSSPDQLRIGVEIIIPAVPGHDRPPADRSTGRRRESKTAREPGADELPNARPFRWYQIQKNDRYISIAREQLGDASRWREIFDLNQDKFPDPGMIREGVRIKLPTVELADARQGRR